MNEKPAVYASYYPILRSIAIEYGYALALHGSLLRDLDLIAVAWIKRPKSYKRMVKVMAKSIGGYIIPSALPKKGEKPHGRMTYSISSGGGGFIDLSIIPPRKGM